MKKLPKSMRKYLRRQKAHIRREILDVAEQNKQIKKLYAKINQKQPVKNKRNKAPSKKTDKKSSGQAD